MPFTYGGSTAGPAGKVEVIKAYFDAEVKPHVPDAWIDWAKTKIGYEIPFTRHFYKYVPPRPLAEIDADLEKQVAKILELLREVEAVTSERGTRRTRISWLPDRLASCRCGPSRSDQVRSLLETLQRYGEVGYADAIEIGRHPMTAADESPRLHGVEIDAGSRPDGRHGARAIKCTWRRSGSQASESYDVAGRCSTRLPRVGSPISFADRATSTSTS